MVAPAARLDIGELLAKELGSSRVIRPDDEKLEDYGRDESGLGLYTPDCAVLCQSSAEVASVLALCAEHRVPVTPRGAGSGRVGGALPVRGGVVLSTERMGRVIEIDTDDLVAVVEPGVITGDLQSAVEEVGLFYPPDPASLAYCSLGGNVAANAGGARAFKYGVTRPYVLGLEVVLMGGEVLRCGRRTAKGVTGYDLVGGFVGSEGTFGVSTELTLRLLPKPPAVETLLAAFVDLNAAGEAVKALLGRGFRPRTLELADRLSIDHVRDQLRIGLADNAGAVLLIELDGDEGLTDSILAAGHLCEDVGALDVIVAQSSAERRRLWQARRGISPALKHAHRHKIAEDICVPPGSLPEMLRRIDRIAADCDLPAACFGHAGDGNIHVNFLLDDDLEDPANSARVERAITQLFTDTIELRGTLSGEHGIGLTKKKYMPLEQSARVLEWQRRWKRMWDPHELLNPGKVIPESRPGCTE